MIDEHRRARSTSTDWSGSGSADLSKYPNCPECDTDFWVVGEKGDDSPKWKCHNCGRRWS